MTDEAPADVVIQTSHQSQCYRIVQFHQDRSLHAFPPALGNKVNFLCMLASLDSIRQVTSVLHTTGIGTGAKKQQSRPLLSVAARGHSQFDTIPQLVQQC